MQRNVSFFLGVTLALLASKHVSQAYPTQEDHSDQEQNDVLTASKTGPLSIDNGDIGETKSDAGLRYAVSSYDEERDVDERAKQNMHKWTSDDWRSLAEISKQKLFYLSQRVRRASKRRGKDNNDDDDNDDDNNNDDSSSSSSSEDDDNDNKRNKKQRAKSKKNHDDDDDDDDDDDNHKKSKKRGKSRKNDDDDDDDDDNDNNCDDDDDDNDDDDDSSSSSSSSSEEDKKRGKREIEDDNTSDTSESKTSEEKNEPKNRLIRAVGDTSESSSEEKDKPKNRLVREVNQISVESKSSSEEKNKPNNLRFIRKISDPSETFAATYDMNESTSFEENSEEKNRLKNPRFVSAIKATLNESESPSGEDKRKIRFIRSIDEVGGKSQSSFKEGFGPKYRRTSNDFTSKLSFKKTGDAPLLISAYEVEDAIQPYLTAEQTDKAHNRVTRSKDDEKKKKKKGKSNSRKKHCMPKATTVKADTLNQTTLSDHRPV